MKGKTVAGRNNTTRRNKTQNKAGSEAKGSCTSKSKSIKQANAKRSASAKCIPKKSSRGVSSKPKATSRSSRTARADMVPISKKRGSAVSNANISVESDVTGHGKLSSSENGHRVRNDSAASSSDARSSSNRAHNAEFYDEAEIASLLRRLKRVAPMRPAGHVNQVLAKIRANAGKRWPLSASKKYPIDVGTVMDKLLVTGLLSSGAVTNPAVLEASGRTLPLDDFPLLRSGLSSGDLTESQESVNSQGSCKVMLRHRRDHRLEYREDTSSVDTRVQRDHRRTSCRRTGSDIEVSSISRQRQVTQERDKKVETEHLIVRRITYH